MAKITFTKISIENLGPFRERQTINLNVSSGKPVVLIKALNGSGKTTLLTALQIGLYGYKAINPTRKSEYDQLVLGLQRKDAVGNSLIEITLDIEVGNNKKSVLLRREWDVRGTNATENFTVLSDGIVDIDFTESWDDYINGILPVELVHLFLFDGEKIEALANPERLPELLRRATEVFLGLGGIDALANDLKAVERRTGIKNKDSSGAFDETSLQLDTFQSQLEEIEQTISILTQKQADARNTLEKAQIDLEKFSLRARRLGLDAFKQAAELKGSVDLADKQLKDARAALVEAVGDPILPLAWLGPLWERYKTQWDQDRKAHHAAILIDEFEKRDQRVLASMNLASPVNAELLSKVLNADLVEFTLHHQKTPILLSGADPADVQTHLDSAMTQVEKCLVLVKKTHRILEKADKSVSEVPAEEQLGSIFDELQMRSKLVVTTEKQLQDIIDKLVETRTSQMLVESRLNAARQRVGSEYSERTLEMKGIEAASRAKKALNLFRERLLASKAQWLSEMITSEFRGLLRKRRLISKVVVDPLTYAVSIEDVTGHVLPMERLSAGERQILAISVLSALIRERKGRFPVVVDTPLARLDRQHRESLIRNFFSKISHQVMALSTDEEVDGPVYEALVPYVSQEYELAFEDDSRRSVAHSRKFKMELAG
jgi:DNA sulfur modification protein DndD